jgi:hypothetical protein
MLFIREFQALSEAERVDLLRILIPTECFEQFHIDPESFTDPEGRLRLRALYRDQGRILGVRVIDPMAPLDPIYSIFLQDYEEDGVDCIGLNINDPQSQRFEVDLDEYGRIPADFFSGRRNIEEEIRAMRAGLAPGQVRKGLRMIGGVLKGLEAFMKRIGKRWIYCEAMAYHNAMVYERHGFGYQFRTWENEMLWIDLEFRPPRGIFFKKLDGSSPFRQRGMERTVRGRSWAIHDGVMGRPWARPGMVKEVGVHCEVNTFPHGQY